MTDKDGGLNLVSQKIVHDSFSVLVNGLAARSIGVTWKGDGTRVFEMVKLKLP